MGFTRSIGIESEGFTVGGPAWSPVCALPGIDVDRLSGFDVADQKIGVCEQVWRAGAGEEFPLIARQALYFPASRIDKRVGDPPAIRRDIKLYGRKRLRQTRGFHGQRLGRTLSAHGNNREE